jgi:hypothetical protein
MGCKQTHRVRDPSTRKGKVDNLWGNQRRMVRERGHYECRHPLATERCGAKFPLAHGALCGFGQCRYIAEHLDRLHLTRLPDA